MVRLFDTKGKRENRGRMGTDGHGRFWRQCESVMPTPCVCCGKPVDKGFVAAEHPGPGALRLRHACDGCVDD